MPFENATITRIMSCRASSNSGECCSATQQSTFCCHNCFTTMAANKNYKAILIQFMSYCDQIDYEKEHEFTQVELLAITPIDLVRWMSLKVYGNPEPGENDNPIRGRSSSLEHYKKAISSFMPNKHMAWNVMANQGNPTKSPQVNALIGQVQKKEVRRQGAPSMAR
jgi:hypothetical protein